MIKTDTRKGHIEKQIEKIGGISRIREIYRELNNVSGVCDRLIDEGAIIEEQSLKNFLKRKSICLSNEGEFKGLGSSQRAFLKLCGEEDPESFLRRWYTKTESVIELVNIFEERFSAKINHHRIAFFMEDYGIKHLSINNKSKVQRIVYEREGRPLLVKIYQNCSKDLNKTIAYFEKEFDAVISRASLAKWLKIEEKTKVEKAAKTIPFARAAEFGIDIGIHAPLMPVIVYIGNEFWGVRDKYIYKKGGDFFAKWKANLYKISKSDGLNSIRVSE